MHTRYMVGWICAVAWALTGCERLQSENHNAFAATPPSSAPTFSSKPVSAGTPAILPGAPDVAGLAERARPAVVNVTVTGETNLSDAPFQFPFDFFFGPQNPPGRPRGDRMLQRRAVGSGFIIDDAGHVVTNAHVVAGAKTVKVRLFDEREFSATVRGRDPKLDVAVLDLVGAAKLPKIELGSSDATRVGDYVVAIGNPFGLGDTVTMGIVSAKSRAIGAGPYDDFIQTDAAINPGNSGGPLLNILGQVIGINTAINPSGQGIGFAIPIDDVKQVLPQLLATGHVSRGRLGVAVQMMDESTAKALGLDRSRGSLVADVESNGPAAKAGLRPGDVILGVNQTAIRDSHELPRVVAAHKPGAKVTLKVWRDGAERSFEVTLDELKEQLPAEATPSASESAGTATPSVGVNIADTRAGPTVVRVQPGGAAEGQLQTGDVILEVNREAVKDVGEVSRRIEQAPRDRPVLLRIRRGDNEQFVGIAR
jgi:serine protease Do